MAQSNIWAPGEDSPVPAIAVVGARGDVVGWSRMAEELLGYSPAEILGRPGTDLRMERDRASRLWTWGGEDGDDDHQAGIFDLRHRDGDQIVAHFEWTRIATPGGAPAWVVAALPVGLLTLGASVLEPLLSAVPVVMVVWDPELRPVWRNEQARRLERAFPFFQVGRPLPVDLAEADMLVPPELIREVLAEGVPVVDHEVRWETPDRNEGRTFSTFLFRVEGVDSRPLGVCLMAVDITHSGARERLALLRRASIQIGTTLDVRQTAQELADLAVPAFADYVTVDLTEAVLPGPEPLERLEANASGIPTFLRAGLASIHDEIPESLWPRGQPVYVPPSSPFTEVLASGRSHFEPRMETTSANWLDRDPDRARTVRATGMHTLIIVPLKARGNLLGIAVFVRTDNQAPFTRDDLALAEELGARAALSLDSARQYTREHDAALALQRQLLPSRLRGGDMMELASRYLPSDVHQGVGGDWYDAIRLNGSRLALVVGDVTGHGINAAASMGRLRTAVRTLAYLGLPPDELLARLDELYAAQTEDEDGDALSPIAATCLYAVHDPATGRCVMASAGHLPPAIVRPGGDVSFPGLPAGNPIGLGLGAHRSAEFELDEGTTLALYTDGLIERRDHDLNDGMRRLGTALTRDALPLDDLCTSVIDAMMTRAAEDDVTLLLAKTLTSNR
ncbi:SpoIIE family protein phosphatase [Actinomadura monticuli]|uniref:SpoIIE family protein phosphatase n=1 Tax=Actinomadura monticuli TaxID=3097367 RepID=A0ABV4QHM3_9ACTN